MGEGWDERLRARRGDAVGAKSADAAIGKTIGVQPATHEVVTSRTLGTAAVDVGFEAVPNIVETAWGGTAAAAARTESAARSSRAAAARSGRAAATRATGIVFFEVDADVGTPVAAHDQF